MEEQQLTKYRDKELMKTVDSIQHKISLSNLNSKQRKFCLMYPATGSPIEAARMAGYCLNTDSEKERTARLRGTVATLLRNTKIRNNIDILNNELETLGVATALRIKLYWTSLLEDDNQPEKIRLEASKLLAKCYPDFSEKVVVEAHTSHTEFKEHKVVFESITPGVLGRMLGLDKQEAIDVTPEPTIDDL